MESDSATEAAANADVRAGAGVPGSVSVGELSLGLLVLAWERLNGSPDGRPAEPAALPRPVPLALGVAAATTRAGGSLLSAVARRAAAPASFAGVLATSLPGTRGIVRRLSGRVDGLLKQGEDIAERARHRTVAFLQVATMDGLRWTEVELAPQLIESMMPRLVKETVPEIIDGLMPHLVAKVAPQLVDGIVPHLVNETAPEIIDGLLPHIQAAVAPQLVEGLLPEIRERVLPVVIADVADDPRVRTMVLQQSRGLLAEATDEARARAVDADDWLEQRFRRLFRRRRAARGGASP
jgi:hypothetical protein